MLLKVTKSQVMFFVVAVHTTRLKKKKKKTHLLEIDETGIKINFDFILIFLIISDTGRHREIPPPQRFYQYLFLPSMETNINTTLTGWTFFVPPMVYTGRTVE